MELDTGFLGLDTGNFSDEMPDFDLTVFADLDSFFSVSVFLNI